MPSIPFCPCHPPSPLCHDTQLPASCSPALPAWWRAPVPLVPAPDHMQHRICTYICTYIYIHIHTTPCRCGMMHVASYSIFPSSLPSLLRAHMRAHTHKMHEWCIFLSVCCSSCVPPPSLLQIDRRESGRPMVTSHIQESSSRQQVGHLFNNTSGHHLVLCTQRQRNKQQQQQLLLLLLIHHSSTAYPPYSAKQPCRRDTRLARWPRACNGWRRLPRRSCLLGSTSSGNWRPCSRGSLCPLLLLLLLRLQ